MVTLAWDTDATHRAKRYNVGRSQTKGVPYQLLFRGLTQPGYIDTSVINGVTYYYVVNAADINGESPLSNEAAATPIAGTVPTPVISPPSGVYWEPISVTITEANRNISIRYTLDGTIPTTSSALYTGPFTLSQNATVTARAFYPGKIPSAVVSASYIVIEPTASVTITSPSYGATLQTGATVSVSATANAIDPDVLIDHLDFYANGEFIGQVNGGSGTVKWTPTTEGDYDLTAAASDVFGVVAASDPVTVTVTGTPTPPVLSCGQTLSGTLAITDAPSVALGAQHYADRYTFHAAAGETIILTLSSGSFDAYLTLYEVNGTQIASNDDSLNQTTNAQIIYTIPTIGVYTVEATSYPPSQTGPYTLQLLCSPSGAAGQLSVSVNGTTVANNGLLDFGSTPQGVPLSKTLTLTNTGNADLAITGITGSGDWNIGTLGNLSQNVISPGQSASLTARFNATNLGGASGTLVLNNTTVVNPYTINLTGTTTTGPTVSVTVLTLNPTIITGGTNSTATITLSGPAPNGGQLIGLSSDTPGVISMPTSVIVPTGQSTYSLTIRTRAVLVSTPVTITAYIGLASAPFSSAQATLTLNSPGDPPTVTLDAPTNNSTYSSSTIAFSATATAHTAGATITKVEFFNGNTKIGEDASVPYTFSWTNVGAGDYTLHAVATDSNGLTGRSADVTIHVIDLPPLSTPTISPNGGVFTGFVSVTIADTDAGVTLFYTLDGTDPDTTSPRYTGAFVLPASATPIVVTARAFKQGYAPSDPATATFTINPVSGLARPTVSITSPGDGAEITGVPASSAVGKTSIIGSVTSTALAYWTLEYQSVGDSNWVTFAQGTNAVNNNTIGYLDTTLMLDGQYDIRLTAVDQAGQMATPAIITIVIKGHQKVGYFTVSFTDMTIPIAGIPISITRTYDSRDKSNGDFGVGWTLSTTNAKVQKRQVSGYNWNQVRQGGGFSQAYYLRPARPHLVTITLPGDTVYSFQETVSPAGQAFYPLDGTTVVYQQVSGPKATLNPVGVDPNVFVGAPSFDDDPNASSTAVELYDGSNPDQIYNPTEFVLTLHNGTKLDITQANGLQAITDRNGNVVTFSYNGNGGCTSIDSQDGRSIVINRGGVNGTISSITDFNGNSVRYFTDSLGNLVTFTNRLGSTNRFSYDYQHNLTNLYGSSGNERQRNYYLPDGRIDYSVDGHNKPTNYYYDKNLEPNSSTPPANSPISMVPSNSKIILDRLARPTVLTYDSYGNTTQKTQYLIGSDMQIMSITEQYQFSDANNPDQITRVIDPMGHVTDYSYDSNGCQLTTAKHLTKLDGTKEEIRTLTSYNGYGEPITLTDANGVVITTNTYDNFGNLIATADALGYKMLSSYNAIGTLSSTTNAKNGTEYYGYDPQGNLKYFIDLSGQKISYTYDNNGNKLTQSMQRKTVSGNTETLLTQFTVDAEGNVLGAITPNNTTSQMAYNAKGKIDHTVDSLGRITSYQYDDFGQLVQINYPDHTKRQSFYDDEGRVIKIVERSGRGIQNIYDTLNRIVRVIPLGSDGNPYLSDRSSAMRSHLLVHHDSNANIIYSDTVYDNDGHPIKNIDEYGFSTYTTYDDLGRVITTTDATGNITNYQYDNADHQIATIDANNHQIAKVYDTNGHLLKIDYPDGTSTKYVYDSLGLCIAETDQADHTKQNIYNQLSQLIAVIAPSGAVTKFEYDELGEKIGQIDANGHKTSFEYDNNGRLVKRTLPGGQSETLTYDIGGRLARLSDFNQAITNFIYDPITNLLQKKQDANGNDLVSFDYNNDTTLHTALRGNIVTNYEYNTYGLIGSITDPNGQINYDYDLKGRLISVEEPSGKVSFTYDPSDRLLSVLHPNNSGSSVYAYDKVGNIIRFDRGNNVTTLYNYDTLNRLTDISNNVGSSYHYTLLADGKRSSVSDRNGIINYSYNQDGALTQESGVEGTIEYIYGQDNLGRTDSVGNRLQKIVNGVITTYSYDVNNRLVQDGINSYGYDNNGNLTTLNGQPYYHYDLENELTSVGPIDALMLRYNYDAFGNRISRVTANTTSNYLIDKTMSLPSIVEERNESGNLIARYDYGNGLVRMDRSDANSGIYYYIKDGTDSTRTLVKGTSVYTYDYDAFGNLISSSTGATALTYFLFNGQQFDSSTGLYNLRARDYNPSSGRMLASDPMLGSSSDPVSLHPYLYADNDPVNFVDPSGETPWGLAFGGEVHNKISEDFMGLTTAGLSTPTRLLGPADYRTITRLGDRDYNKITVLRVMRVISHNFRYRIPWPSSIFTLARPDLTDFASGHKVFYEIKPISEWEQGLAEIVYYGAALNLSDPSHPNHYPTPPDWTVGEADTYIPPPILSGFSDPNDRAVVFPPIAGLILYQGMDRRLLWTAVEAALMASIGQQFAAVAQASGGAAGPITITAEKAAVRPILISIESASAVPRAAVAGTTITSTANKADIQSSLLAATLVGMFGIL